MSMTTPSPDWADEAAKAIWNEIDTLSMSRLPRVAAIIRRHAKQREDATMELLTSAFDYHKQSGTHLLHRVRADSRLHEMSCRLECALARVRKLFPAKAGGE